jgi:predicted lipoprotein with Yx(FWY)xxD motif
MRNFSAVVSFAVAAAFAVAGGAHAADIKGRLTEDYVKAPLPPGFQVMATELEGPVFADASGKTMYKWPIKSIRNGDVGEQKGKPTCDDTVYKVNAGLMSPYPGGFTLPDVETRPSCLQVWPAVYASADAKPVGKWTVVDRKDGKKQWAYDGYALYTSVLDEVPGDTRGGTRRKAGGDSPAYREPVSPAPNIPAQFGVYAVARGRLLGTATGYSVYTYDKDSATKSNCVAGCLNEWAPMLAAENAIALGDWSILERAPGVKQWAFRKKPLYTKISDEKFRSFEGSDVPGWHNVFTQSEPAGPKGFSVQDTRAGQVLADTRGHTLYIYNCGDDAIDELACDNPNSPQAYRFAICGGGDPDKCNKTFPYVMADANAKSDSRAWTTMYIDPKTGKFAKAGQAGAVNVWGYRGRPVYLFGGDKKAGDVEGDAWGEFNGHRNGFKAFWVRDDFRGNAG